MLEVEELIDMAQFQKDVKINPLDLQNGLFEHAGFYAYYGTLAARAARQMAKWKGYLERTEAKVAQTIRLAAEKKPTEAEINSKVRLDAAYQKVLSKYHHACEVYSNCKTAMDAFWQRKEMLTLAARFEMEEKRGALRVFDRGADAELRINEAMSNRYSPTSDN